MTDTPAPSRATGSSPVAAVHRRRPASLPLLLRRVHGYIGMLIAPSLLFFACSGGLQLFRLHEAHDHYTPPAVFEALGAVHKDQILAKPEDGPPPETAGPAKAAPPQPPPERPMKLNTLLLKWVFLAVSVGLFASTGLGIWIALQDRLRRTLNLILLAIGVLLPLVLIFI